MAGIFRHPILHFIDAILVNSSFFQTKSIIIGSSKTSSSSDSSDIFSSDFDITETGSEKPSLT